MANVRLSTKAVGDIVKLNVNGAAREFIVVHQGKPDGTSSIYDDSCNGTWLLMKDCYEKRAWHSTNVNKLENSTIHSYLNSTFLALFDSKIQDAIKQVKIPYRKGGGGYGSSKQSGVNGLSCKVFLLSFNEVGFSGSDADDSKKLDYFESGIGTSANNKRIAFYNGTATFWFLRTPDTGGNSDQQTEYVKEVYTAGNSVSGGVGRTDGIRPALVLPSTLLVTDTGMVSTNTAPTISSTSGASGVNLGTKSAAFSFQYTPSDADGDKLTVTEKLDGVTMKTRTNVTSGTKLTFECASTAAAFQKILNGSHTITIEVSDGQETATFGATFTKAVYSASITLSAPLAVEGDITLAVTSVVGSIPDDATYKVEVTNNAKDSSPVWQDVTQEVKQGANIIFANKTAVNGAAFNFRITCKRGASNAGGYISAVSGAFE